MSKRLPVVKVVELPGGIGVSIYSYRCVACPTGPMDHYQTVSQTHAAEAAQNHLKVDHRADQ